MYNIERIVTLTDLHLGRFNNDEVIEENTKEFLRSWLEELGDTSNTLLLVNGDTFDNRLSINLKTMNLFRWFAELIYDKFEYIIFNLGNHDMTGRTTTDSTIFDIIETDWSASHHFGENDPEIVREPTSFQLLEMDMVIQVFPYGTLKKESQYDKNATYIFTHENLPPKPSKKAVVLNGHIHNPSDVAILKKPLGQVYNLGSAYQLDAGQADDILGYHVIDKDGIRKVVFNGNRPYLNIRIFKNKIEDLQPVKWLMANRELIKNSREIKIIVDHETSKATLEKFYGVLSTINSNYNMVDSITAATETKVTTNKTIIDSLFNIMPEEGGYIDKVRHIYAEATA